jgi:hypothetical protein
MLPRCLPRRLQDPLLKCLLTLFQLAQLLGACVSFCFSDDSLSSQAPEERLAIALGGFLSSVLVLSVSVSFLPCALGSYTSSQSPLFDIWPCFSCLAFHPECFSLRVLPTPNPCSYPFLAGVMRRDVSTNVWMSLSSASLSVLFVVKSLLLDLGSGHSRLLESDSMKLVG